MRLVVVVGVVVLCVFLPCLNKGQGREGQGALRKGGKRGGLFSCGKPTHPPPRCEPPQRRCGEGFCLASCLVSLECTLGELFLVALAKCLTPDLVMAHRAK